MTVSDSESMRMPKPIVRDTSCILISKKRLIAVLGHLGYFSDTVDGQYLLAMIHSLWQEAHEYASGNVGGAAAADNDNYKYNTIGKPEDGNETTSSRNDDDEDSSEGRDLIELGTLKWILYGFPARQPSWWPDFCLPCGSSAADKALTQRQNNKAQQEHPITVSGMKRRHGELVRHDVMTCKLCINATDWQPKVRAATVGVGSGFAAYPGLFKELQRIPNALPHARDLLALAKRDWELGRALDAHLAQPVYLRNEVAVKTKDRVSMKTD